MSAFTDPTAAAQEHCEAMAGHAPDLAEQYRSMAALLQKKLYHQLTVAVLEFVSAPDRTLRTTPDGASSYLALYDKVVLSVDKRLNQLTLARIAAAVADATAPTDGDSARTVLENLLADKRDRLGPSAALYVESKLALLGLALLQRNAPNVDGPKHLAFTEELLRKNEKVLAEQAGGGGGAAAGGGDAAASDAAVVHSAHYECAMVYRKAVGPPEAYYREAVQYLHYTPLDALPDGERLALATDLSMAALTGDGVYNFGEVVQHPILRCLVGTPNAWLVELMEASAAGDVAAFRAVSTRHAAEIAAQPALTGRAQMVQEKITLLAMVHMIFERPSSERTLRFADIAGRIEMAEDQVELVVMRALSLGLIRGSMDQVDGTVEVTWVMPRVLDAAQLSDLAGRFGEWAVKVSQTKDYMSEQAFVA
jgi:26S proteasome regulatory subunit N9